LIVGILTTVIGSLILTGLIALFNSRQLYLIVPKLFFDTPLSTPSAKGNVVQLTFYNAGLRPELDVKAVLKATCDYTLIASSKSTLSYTSKTISLPRLARFESITVILLVEGKIFEHSDIESIESRDDVGKVIEKKEQASTPLQHVIALPLVLIFLLVPFGLGTYFGKEMQFSIVDFLYSEFDSLGSSSILVSNFKTEISKLEGYPEGELLKAMKSGSVNTKIARIVKKRESLELDLLITNNSQGFISVDVTGKNSAGDGAGLTLTDRFISDLLVLPGKQEKRTLKFYFPDSPEQKLVMLDYRVGDGKSSVTYSEKLDLESLTGLR
jgi:hypothetical protein